MVQGNGSFENLQTVFSLQNAPSTSLPAAWRTIVDEVEVRDHVPAAQVAGAVESSSSLGISSTVVMTQQMLVMQSLALV
ncbi:hypothetical protein KIN20_015135 [Parelaphostrongylus tenuis]|uniref:Uncharacterized protein n=1 Tax=Parelaphostrongylus tenuis TaxID=148309 RepID=A0AAD5MEG6_PARTN|nr:hypothetical protein KIN20_015135 [Parelaphostrongylus tenuis]